ncbi:MAG: ion transporter [Chloroflexota bacterium]
MRLRKSIEGFFEKHEVAWEAFMIVLAVAFLAIGFLPYVVTLAPGTQTALDRIDLAITIIFALEFGVRFSVAPSRRIYLKERWLDIVAILPAVRWLRFARLARVFRLLRIARVVRIMDSLDRVEFDFSRFARLNGLQWTLLTLTMIMLLASFMLFLFERRVNPEIRSYWDALYAALVTWTTPGYGDIMPMTTNGRICGLVLIISGLVTWGVLIANLAAFLATRVSGNDKIDPALKELFGKLNRLDQLTQAELISLKGALTALIDDRIEEFDEVEPLV